MEGITKKFCEKGYEIEYRETTVFILSCPTKELCVRKKNRNKSFVSLFCVFEISIIRKIFLIKLAKWQIMFKSSSGLK